MQIPIHQTKIQMKKGILLTGLALMAVSANAQCLKDGYIKQGFGSPEFATTVMEWHLNDKAAVTADDNFFISRVKPKARFRNVETQVNPDLDATNDKRLVAWIPINTPMGNALPDGKFDSEVFNINLDRWEVLSIYE